MGFSPFRTTGLTYLDEAKSFGGYTLFCPLSGHETVLIDIRGKIAHRWVPPVSTWKTYYGELLENGNLLALYEGGFEAKPGGCSAIAEVDWSGKLVWKYENRWLHHHFVRRANGNTVVLLWDRVPPELAEQLVDRRGPEVLAPREVLSDALWEVTPTGEVIWRWRACEHLDPTVDRICPLHGYNEWTHANSVAELPNGDLLVCFRLTDTVVIIERATGKLRWKWGRGVISHAHDATYLSSGNVLLFDNEWHKEGRLDSSSLIEVDPADNRVNWKYVASPNVSFSSAHLGGAQRLPNGNTFVCEGSCGRLFEIGTGGDVVWEYVNPFVATYREDTRSPRIVKARRYGTNDPRVSRLGS